MVFYHTLHGLSAFWALWTWRKSTFQKTFSWLPSDFCLLMSIGAWGNFGCLLVTQLLHQNFYMWNSPFCLYNRRVSHRSSHSTCALTAIKKSVSFKKGGVLCPSTCNSRSSQSGSVDFKGTVERLLLCRSKGRQVSATSHQEPSCTRR